jgi:hypothetical protein
MGTTASKFFLTLSLCASFSLSGCASLNPLDLFSSSTETEDASVSAQSHVGNQRRKTEPVDAFVIRYGYRPADLTQETKIMVPQLQKTQDPHYGSVYRYIIQPVEAGKNLYVAIASVKGDQISEFSSPMEEQPK